MTSPAAEFCIRPQPVTGLGFAWTVGCLVLTLLPWVCGLPPLPALGVMAMTLAGWRSGMNSLPGAHHTAARLHLQGPRVRLEGGHGSVEARLLPASRIGAGWVLLRLQSGRRRMNWWIPARSLDAASFRRLRVFVRCSATPGTAGC
jgi:hypothetical protein